MWMQCHTVMHEAPPEESVVCYTKNYLKIEPARRITPRNFKKQPRAPRRRYLQVARRCRRYVLNIPYQGKKNRPGGHPGRTSKAKQLTRHSLAGLHKLIHMQQAIIDSATRQLHPCKSSHPATGCERNMKSVGNRAKPTSPSED